MTASNTTEEQILFEEAYRCADNCDTCWYLCSTEALDKFGDAVTVPKLRFHLANGHRTTSEDEVD